MELCAMQIYNFFKALAIIGILCEWRQSQNEMAWALREKKSMPFSNDTYPRMSDAQGLTTRDVSSKWRSDMEKMKAMFWAMYKSEARLSTNKKQPRIWNNIIMVYDSCAPSTSIIIDETIEYIHYITVYWRAKFITVLCRISLTQ